MSPAAPSVQIPSSAIRRRSHWGWGYEDRFASRRDRVALAERVRKLCGVGGLRIEDPVPLDAVRMPESRITPPSTLRAIFDPTPQARASHTYGKGYRDLLRGLRGEFQRAPDLVAEPRTEDEVAAVLDWATDRDVGVIPFGGGTSVVGGVEAAFTREYAGAVSLDLRRMNRVLEVDRRSRAARIQAGATGLEVNAHLMTHGLAWRHFPQSYEFATIGGMLATRSAGHFATVLTHIDDLVESIRMVTPRGVCEPRRLPASGAGPNPDRLVLGSEGAFGVITEAWLRIHDRPRFQSTAAVRFACWSQAVNAVRALGQSGLNPHNCRLLDAREAAMYDVGSGDAHMLVVGFESGDKPTAPRLAEVVALCREFGGQATDPTGRDRDDASSAWRQAFFDAPYLQTNLVSTGLIVDTFETACTWDRFDALHDAVLRGVGDAMVRVSGGGLITCRLTHVYPDGVAPYFTFVAAATPGGELAQWAEIKAAASEIVLAHGGTITHHHGVGRVHRAYYEREASPLFLAALRAAKSVLDPAGILNPGVLVP